MHNDTPAPADIIDYFINVPSDIVCLCISGALIAAILLLCAVILVRRRQRLRRQRELGEAGEQLVSEILTSLPANRYITLADIMLPSDLQRSKTAQIDHVVLSNHGIFVLEVKNYGGAVYGHENGEKWVQYRSGKKREFYSPLAQNEAHIAALMSLLDLPRSCFISAAVFTPRAQLHVRRNSFLRKLLHWNIRFENAHVVVTHNLRRFIRRTDSREAMPYSIEAAAEIIDSASIDSKRERSIHNKIVKNL